MKSGSKRKASASDSTEARITDDQSQQPVDVIPGQPDLNLPPNNEVDSVSPKNSTISCGGPRRSARREKLRCLTSLAVSSVDVIQPSLEVLNTSTARSCVGIPLAANVNEVDSPPKNCISLCCGRRRSARRQKQCLRCLNSLEVASDDVTLPSLQVPTLSTAKSNVAVPLAANVNVRVPSLPVIHASTTNSDAVIPSASPASSVVKVPALPVPNTSTTQIDVGVHPEGFRKLFILKKKAKKKETNQLPAQSSLVASSVFASIPSLTGAAAGPQSQSASNEVIVKEQPAPSTPMPMVCTDSSRSPSFTSTASCPVPQRSTNEQTPVAREEIEKPVQVNNDPFCNMRLNIDDMSYEELLALQEQIGYVSTGLSGNELVKARKVATYRVKRRKTRKDAEVDTKCSICQEEYVAGDKLGNLKCKHGYHLTCIEQWLQQKNWCPTCKTDVKASL